MADTKISGLSASTTPLAGTEVLPIVQSGSTVKVSVANLTAGRSVAMAGGSFTDNITQSTAAKGVNFTANTPAAGMTSRLLNWYEEGTWTPNDASGAALTFASAVGKYTRVGRQVTYFAWVTYPTTASGAAVVIGGLPFVAASTNDGNGVTSYNSAGFQMFLRPNATNNFTAVKNDNSAVTNANLTGALFGFQYTIFV